MSTCFSKWNYLRRDDPPPRERACCDMRELQKILVEVKPGIRPLPGVEHLAAQYQRDRATAPAYNHLDRYAFGVDIDEVFPGLFIGDEGSARNRDYLRHLGVTHVVNTAEGRGIGQVNTSAQFYAPHQISYLGIGLDDAPYEDLTTVLHPAAVFIHDALQSGGKVLVHCLMGMSRSASIAIAYLMHKQNMTVDEALKTIRANRAVRPNNGFLMQLIKLDTALRAQRENSLNQRFLQ